MGTGREPVEQGRQARPTPEPVHAPVRHSIEPAQALSSSVIRRAVGNQRLGSVAVAARAGPGERAAQEAEARGSSARRSTPAPTAATASGRSRLADDDGRPVPGEPAARVHQSPSDREFVALLGARAATHGRDIFLGQGESTSDQALMAHELTHVHEGGDLLRLRSATWLERRAWLAFFDHYLPRRFLNNYMDDTGTPIRLTLREMADCNPIVDLRRSRDFMSRVAALAAGGGGTAALTVRGWGGARTNGTLGNFTITYTGTVVVRADGTWTFSGTMTFGDYWDFDPKGSGSNRPWAAEVKVRVAAAALPGRPFEITSVPAAVSQSSSDSRATWGSGAAPVHVPDRAGRTGADIVVGDVGGGEVGAEVGAQSAEDLN